MEKKEKPNTPKEQPKKPANNCSPFETRAKNVEQSKSHMFSAKKRNDKKTGK